MSKSGARPTLSSVGNLGLPVLRSIAVGLVALGLAVDAGFVLAIFQSPFVRPMVFLVAAGWAMIERRRVAELVQRVL
jgi:hypothetical protein